MTELIDSKKSELLTETFFMTDVSDADIKNLKEAVAKANKSISTGKLVLVDHGTDAMSIEAQIPYVLSKKMSKDQSVEQSMSVLTEMLQHLSLGTAKTMNEDMAEDSNHFSLSDYFKHLSCKILDHAESFSVLSKELSSDDIVERLGITLNDLDCFDAYSIDGREELVKYALSRKYWHQLCTKKLSSIVKELDAQALRIALHLKMDVL